MLYTFNGNTVCIRFGNTLRGQDITVLCRPLNGIWRQFRSDESIIMIIILLPLGATN